MKLYLSFQLSIQKEVANHFPDFFPNLSFFFNGNQKSQFASRQHKQVKNVDMLRSQFSQSFKIQMPCSSGTNKPPKRRLQGSRGIWLQLKMARQLFVDMRVCCNLYAQFISVCRVSANSVGRRFFTEFFIAIQVQKDCSVSTVFFVGITVARMLQLI